MTLRAASSRTGGGSPITGTTITATTALVAPGGTNTTASITFAGALASQGFYSQSNVLGLIAGNVTQTAVIAGTPEMRNAVALAITWASTASAVGSAGDTGLSRVSAGVVGVGTGAAAAVDGALVAATFRTSAPVTETNATHTLAATTSYLIANRAGTITVTLPAASSFTGRQVTIKTIQAQTVVSNSSDTVPLVGGSAGTAILAGTAGKWAKLVSDGANWVIMEGN